MLAYRNGCVTSGSQQHSEEAAKKMAKMKNIAAEKK